MPAMRCSDFDVEHLATAIHAVFGIHAMRPEGAAIGRILGELWSFESIGRTTVGAAAFGLFAFRIGHDGWVFERGRLLAKHPRFYGKVQVNGGAPVRQAR